MREIPEEFERVPLHLLLQLVGASLGMENCARPGDISVSVLRKFSYLWAYVPWTCPVQSKVSWHVSSHNRHMIL